jgi:chemotaxis regulatin CheY-phosphate phosphatase CheZ
VTDAINQDHESTYLRTTNVDPRVSRAPGLATLARYLTHRRERRSQMDDRLHDIKMQAINALDWYNFTGPVMKLCNYIAELEERIARLEAEREPESEQAPAEETNGSDD